MAVGGEFRVNADRYDLPNDPVVAMDAQGDFVIVWFSAVGVRFDVFARRYSAEGVPLSPQFRVNTTTRLDQNYPAVAMDHDGDFVVVWDDISLIGGSLGIYGQRYNAAGLAIGGEFRIDTTMPVVPSDPAVAMDSDGDFVVVWEAPDGSSDGIFAQRFNAAGAAVGGEFRVNNTTNGNQYNPAVAMDAVGNFVIAWNSSDRDFGAIVAQRYNAAGVAIGGEFLVNTTTSGIQESPSVAMNATGDFVITWQSNPQDGSSYGVYAQRYTAEGVANGREFRVNNVTAGSQRDPVVAIDGDGDFVVTWQSDLQDGSDWGVYLNRFSSNALPVLAAALADQTAAENTALSFTIPAGSFTDPDADDVVTLSAGLANGAPLPSWLVFDPGTRVFSGTPPFNASGSLTIRVTATDLIGATASDDFTLSIANTNQAPALALPLADRIAAEGATFSFTIPAGSFTDPDGDALTLSATLANGDPLPSWLSFTPTTRSFSGTAPIDASVNLAIRVTGMDASGATAFDDFSLAVGAEIRANTYTSGHQQDPAVAMDAAGSFVVVWASSQDSSLDGIYAQRFNAVGMAVGGEFRVNTTTLNSQSAPAVAMDADGDFMVTWESPDGSSDGVYAQRFNAAGIAVGSEFRVNTNTANDQGRSAVAMDADGDFVITWESFVQDGSGDGIYAQRYNAAGVALGGEFRVNTTTTSSQNNPAVAMDAAGSFVIAWDSPQDGSGDGIYAQRYNAAGVALGGEFRVNTTTVSSQNNPAVAMDAAGNFVIAWDSPDGSGDGVYAQRYNVAGAALGGEFRVSTATSDDQFNPTVAMDASGEFIIIWQSNGQDGSGDGIYAQRYNAAGMAIGGEIQVNTFTSSDQQAPAVAMDANGDVTVVWESLGQDGSGYGVYLNLLGDGGDNTLTSSPGADLLAGGAGDDWASYASATVAVTVDLGTGSSSGGHGIDQLIGIEAVLGGSGNDSLLGDGGSNTLNGGAGADTMAGGAGNDVFFVLDAADLVIESAGGGADTIITSVSMTAPVHVESLQIAAGISGITLTGGAGNDMLMGNGLANTFMGGAGDDLILVGTVTLADIYAQFAT
ncbi:MAG: putative Ig domain-containing protein [Roseomonas sp.]|nr:putative Ig domain-containing protein [Roseomonas sp.]